VPEALEETLPMQDAGPGPDPRLSLRARAGREDRDYGAIPVGAIEPLDDETLPPDDVNTAGEEDRVENGGHVASTGVQAAPASSADPGDEVAAPVAAPVAPSVLEEAPSQTAWRTFTASGTRAALRPRGRVP
jgi:hypothetical protein